MRILRGVSLPVWILTAGWIGGAACDVYGGTELPLPGHARPGDPAPLGGGAAGSGATPPEPPGGDAFGGSSDGTGLGPNAGNSGSSEAGSGETAGNSGVTGNGGGDEAAGMGGDGGRAGSGGTAGNGGRTAAGGMAGGGGGAPISACALHPLTPRSTWIASASSAENGGPPSNILDGKLDDRWSTGLQQTSADWLQLDFGAPVGIDRVTLELGNNPSDFPRGYTVRVSNASNDFAAPVRLSGAGQQATDTVLAFATPVTGRYLLIAQTGSVKGLWWSVAEIAVACSH